MRQPIVLMVAWALIVLAVFVVLSNSRTERGRTSAGAIEAATRGTSSGSLVGVANQQLPVATAIPVVVPTSTSSHGQIELSLDPQLYPGQEQELGGELVQALGYVSGRFFGRQPAGSISTAISISPECALNGQAHTTARAVQVFTCNEIDRSLTVAILAHEFVHQLANDHYPPIAQGNDLILVEGLATWGAGDYWLGGQACFAEIARQQRAGGRLYPLATSALGQPTETVNDLYYQWASFVEFLLERYSLEAFDRAYASGNGTPGSANYAGVFQRDLATLEAEWIAWLDQGTCPAIGQ